jgi:hypothetical protein
MSETPYEAAARVADSADDLDLHDIAENVVDAVLALPQVVVLDDADNDKGRDQVEAVAKAMYRLHSVEHSVLRNWEDSGFDRDSYRRDARAALDALRGGSGE